MTTLSKISNSHRNVNKENQKPKAKSQKPKPENQNQKTKKIKNKENEEKGLKQIKIHCHELIKHEQNKNYIFFTSYRIVSYPNTFLFICF